MTVDAARLVEDRLAGVGFARVQSSLARRAVPLRDIDAVGIRQPFAELGMRLFEPGDPAFAVAAERLPRRFFAIARRAEPREGPVCARPKPDAGRGSGQTSRSHRSCASSFSNPSHARRDDRRLRRVQSIDELAAIRRLRLLRQQRQQRRLLSGVAPAFAHDRQHVVGRQRLEKLHDVAASSAIVCSLLPAFEEDACAPALSETRRVREQRMIGPAKRGMFDHRLDAASRPSRLSPTYSSRTRNGQFESRFSLRATILRSRSSSAAGNELRFLVSALAGEPRIAREIVDVVDRARIRSRTSRVCARAGRRRRGRACRACARVRDRDRRGRVGNIAASLLCGRRRRRSPGAANSLPRWCRSISCSRHRRTRVGRGECLRVAVRGELAASQDEQPAIECDRSRSVRKMPRPKLIALRRVPYFLERHLNAVTARAAPFAEGRR